MRKQVQHAAMLRAEARFAIVCGALLLALGLIAALAFTILALAPDAALFPAAGAVFGGPLIFVGWLICQYAAWRLDQARKLESGGAEQPKA
ncbi:MAG: hypothetical protein AB7O04_03755 [Hyphomonadaceae bacterium]